MFDAYTLTLKAKEIVKLGLGRNRSVTRGSTSTQGQQALTFKRPPMGRGNQASQNFPTRPNLNMGRGRVGRGLGAPKTPRNDTQIVCFKCQQPGHKAFNRPSHQPPVKVNLAEKNYEEEDNEGYTYEDQGNIGTSQSYEGTEPFKGEIEELYEYESGEALVVQRTMLSTPRSSEDKKWLLDKIFRTTCTSRGMLCTILIYSGSSENIVSKEVMDKLQLKGHKHLRPYHIQWFKKGGS
ncbi:uncharacterized protein LOC18446097 isoform X2 [Amborella trichopoda]|uniref:uncharacterized protein LOC18446097 isoform X2 n=1 Tax=Amborella trichopoda TaxID=13333 RepID=UPI0009C0C17A|nr:uncharacterized protein LOC18446097 isoform X2 [Amborella trichopoda]|eukprot:XP_020530527.1 uncharacterized protein LOC18446097 isoform X2 [Amborella trichopoda]